MPFGLLTGLGAALSWGTMDIATALASRRIGSLRVTAAIQLVCSVFLVVAAIIARSTFPTDPRALATAALLGLIGAGAYASYFNGLRIGPISVVSGMVAAYGGLTVVLSVVLRGESLTGLQALGATIATIGVILTGVAFDGLRGTRFAGPGVVFAVIALVLFAMMAITMDIALESADWIQVLLVSRLVIVAVSIAAIIALAVAGDRAPGRSGVVRRPDSLPPGRRNAVGRRRPRRRRSGRVRHRVVQRSDLDGRARLVVWAGGHDPRRRRLPRRAAQADPVVRPHRRGDRHGRDRPALTSARQAEPEPGVAIP